MAIVVSLDGRVVSEEEAVVPVLDRGFLYGDSVYEVVRTRRGRPVTLEEHLDRMRGSAQAIYMDLPWSNDELRGHVQALLDASGNEESYIRIVVTRGGGPVGLLPGEGEPPRLIIIAKPLPEPPAHVFTTGLTLVIASRPRNDSRALSPAAKTGNYLNNLLALVEARDLGAEDAILLSPAGVVAEGTTSNLFWLDGEVVHTPSLECGILAGITRAVLLEAMRSDGMTVDEGEHPPEVLRKAQEIFLTSTVRGVAPVTTLDGRPVGDGKPGPVARRVLELYESELDRRAVAE
ncbi:MAG: aminotransferase class IV [Planctomycetota bacterium]|jgi:branched-chain amino acid aminotransferase